MDRETIDRLLHNMVSINEGAKVIDELMNIIDGCNNLIKQVKKNVIDANYNEMFITLKKL